MGVAGWVVKEGFGILVALAIAVEGGCSDLALLVVCPHLCINKIIVDLYKARQINTFSLGLQWLLTD